MINFDALITFLIFSFLFLILAQIILITIRLALNNIKFARGEHITFQTTELTRALLSAIYLKFDLLDYNTMEFFIFELRKYKIKKQIEEEEKLIQSLKNHIEEIKLEINGSKF